MFEGRLTRAPSRVDLARAMGGDVAYEFEVLRYWKGALEATVNVYTPASSSACGRRFRTSERYIIYARYGDGEQLQDNLCSRTRETDRAEEDLAVLGPGKKIVTASTLPSEGDSEPPFISPPPPSLHFPDDDASPPGCRASVSAGSRASRVATLLLLLICLGARRRPRRARVLRD